MFSRLPIISNIIQQAVTVAADLDAIAEATDTMYSAVGNAGQEAIVTNGLPGFTRWAQRALLSREVDPWEMEGEVQAHISSDAWLGSSEIWNEGYQVIEDALGQ